MKIRYYYVFEALYQTYKVNKINMCTTSMLT